MRADNYPLTALTSLLLTAVEVVAQCPDLAIGNPTSGNSIGPVNISGSRLVYIDSNGIVRIHDRQTCDNWTLSELITHDPGGTYIIAVLHTDVLALVSRDTATFDREVHVYRFDALAEDWIREDTLTPSDGEPPFRWGNKIRVADNLIVVSNGMFSEGNVYVYRYDPSGGFWYENTIITPPILNASFGGSIDIFGEFLAIGAYEEPGTCGLNPLCDDGGAVYLYRYNPFLDSWDQYQKLTPYLASKSVFFGSDVAMDGDLLAVYTFTQAIADCTSEHCPTVVEVYRFNGTIWVFEDELIPTGSVSDVIWIADFPRIAISGDRIALPGTSQQNSIYTDFTSIFEYNDLAEDWIEIERIFIDGSGDTDLIFPTTMSGDAVALVDLDLSGTNSNYNYVYCLGSAITDCNGDLVRDNCQLIGNDINFNGIPDECDRSTGDIDLDGTVSVSDLLQLLGAWGACPPFCPSDVNGDRVVNVSDLLILLANWG